MGIDYLGQYNSVCAAILAIESGAEEFTIKATGMTFRRPQLQTLYKERARLESILQDDTKVTVAFPSYRR